MPPSGHEPFLHAICTNPEDDTVRLVYADWLDENGDPERAEFIRLQVALPVKPEEYDPRYARVMELQKKNWGDWTKELPTLSGITWYSHFWRGFVAGLYLSAGKWLVRQREEVFRSTPIQFLTLNDAGLATLKSVLDLPEVERLTGVCLRNCRIREGEWHALARSPRLIHLRTLSFDNRQFPNSGGLRVPGEV